MPNHAIERTATPVNQLAIPQEDSLVGTDQSYTAPIVFLVETMGSMQSILVKQEKVSSKGLLPIIRLSGTGGPTASCSAIVCNPTLWKILKNQGSAGKS